jgi:hypothetical protein
VLERWETVANEAFERAIAEKRGFKSDLLTSLTLTCRGANRPNGPKPVFACVTQRAAAGSGLPASGLIGTWKPQA